MPTGQDPLELRLGPRFLSRASDGSHPLNRECVFLLGRPPGLLPSLGQVREEDVTCHGKRQRNNSIDNEEPSPCQPLVSKLVITLPLPRSVVS